MNVYTGAMERDKREATVLAAQQMLKKPPTDFTERLKEQ
jgi:hypothetical protein